MQLKKLKIKECVLLLGFICLSSFAYPQDTTWFKDVSSKLGFSIVHAGGVIALDVNNDDYPDLLTQYGDKEWHLYINIQNPGSKDPKDRIYVDSTEHSGINVPGMLKSMISAADFNNDGNIDFLTNCWFHDHNGDSANTVHPDDGSRLHLFLGDGKGHFTLKKNSGLEELGPMAGVGMPILDYDRDGNLDIFVANHYSDWFETPQCSFFMKGHGDGTFTNVTKEAGINVSEKDPSKPWLTPPLCRALFGANVADWNNDGNQDILTAPYEATGYPFDAKNGTHSTRLDTGNTVGYGQLYRNNGNGTFTDVGITANYNTHYKWGDRGQGMVPWAAMPYDYDNDGDIDFMVLEVHGGNDPGEGSSFILTNEGPAKNYHLMPDSDKIVRKEPQCSHHGDHNGYWFDFDNDGWADLTLGDAVYVVKGRDANRVAFCRQDPATHKFIDITRELGFMGDSVSSISNKIRRPSVMIAADYDMDGDDDFIKTCYNGDDSLNFLVLRNDISNKNNHITIKLIAPPGVNKSCIGARITVKSGDITQQRDIYAGMGSMTCQGPFILNFGLGKNKMIDSITVRWPDASCSKTVVNKVPVNQFIVIDGKGLVKK